MRRFGLLFRWAGLFVGVGFPPGFGFVGGEVLLEELGYVYLVSEDVVGYERRC